MHSAVVLLVLKVKGLSLSSRPTSTACMSNLSFFLALGSKRTAVTGSLSFTRRSSMTYELFYLMVRPARDGLRTQLNLLFQSSVARLQCLKWPTSLSAVKVRLRKRMNGLAVTVRGDMLLVGHREAADSSNDLNRYCSCHFLFS